MAIQFVVETGAGLTNANSYVTVAEADQYLENSGRKGGTWGTLGSTSKQAALVSAFFFMLARWNERWRGFPTNEDQAGDWPQRDQVKRSGHAYASNEIAVAVKNAQIEYALIEATTPGSLFPNPEYDDTGRVLIESTDKVDVLVETRKYSDKSNPVTFKKFLMADNLLTHITISGSTTPLLRA